MYRSLVKAAGIASEHFLLHLWNMDRRKGLYFVQAEHLSVTHKTSHFEVRNVGVVPVHLKNMQPDYHMK